MVATAARIARPSVLGVQRRWLSAPPPAPKIGDEEGDEADAPRPTDTSKLEGPPGSVCAVQNRRVQRRLTRSARCQRREKVLTVPNLLSLARIVATPVLGYMIVDGQYSAALGLFVAAGITDLLDGWIARKWDQRTVFGAALDPFADKLLMVTLTASTWAAGLLPTPVASLIVARDVCMLVAGFYLRYASLPPPKTLQRYFDIKLPSVDLRPSTLSKYNTAFQLTLLVGVLSGRVFGFEGHVGLTALELLVVGTTVGSGLDYIFNARKYVVFVKQGVPRPKK